jgi:cytochrome c oxidase subunit 2
MGLVLLAVIWLITFISTYFFIAKTWWLPHGASAAAPWIDHQFALTYVIMGIVFLAAQLSLGYLAWKYRDRPGAAPVDYSHGNTKLEAIWTTLTAILFVGLNLMGSHVWASERFEPAKPGAVQVEATGAQFAWYFRYPGADGTYAPTHAKDISAEEQNPLGMEMESADAKDDVVSGVMYLPVNREVDLTLKSQDVIHSLFIPSMRFKQDAVPGLAIHMHFLPVETGDYEIVCAELCGLGHYKMHGMLKVISQEDFDKWLASKEAEKQ